MKSMNFGVVLKSIVVLGLIGGGCVKEADVDSEKAIAPETEQVEKAVVEKAKVAVESETPAWLEEYFGDKLLKADGSAVSLDVLAGKTVGIYFSAHWCPPCRGFTPVLVKAYNEIKAAGKPFEIVFVSSDQSEDKMFNYMKEMKMEWQALPFGSEQKNTLSQKYGVRGIPTLVVVDKDGKTVSMNARGDVASAGAAAFDKW